MGRMDDKEKQLRSKRNIIIAQKKEIKEKCQTIGKLKKMLDEERKTNEEEQKLLKMQIIDLQKKITEQTSKNERRTWQELGGNDNVKTTKQKKKEKKVKMKEMFLGYNGKEYIEEFCKLSKGCTLKIDTKHSKNKMWITSKNNKNTGKIGCSQMKKQKANNQQTWTCSMKIKGTNLIESIY